MNKRTREAMEEEEKREENSDYEEEEGEDSYSEEEEDDSEEVDLSEEEGEEDDLSEEEEEDSSDEEEEDAACAPREFKRLKGIGFPSDIRLLQNVMKLINDFAMTTIEAVMEAADTGQIKWLKELLPRVEDEMDDVARVVTEIGAARGKRAVIRLAFESWDRPSAHKFVLGCGHALRYAYHGSNQRLCSFLGEMYNTNHRDIETVPDVRDNDTFVEIARRDFYTLRMLFKASSEGDIQGVMALATNQVFTEDNLWAMHRTMVLATSNGQFEIVKFFREQFDETLFDLDDDQGINRCPLIAALEAGNVEIAKYLISSNGFDAAMTGSVLSVPSSFSALEVGKLFFDAAKQRRQRWKNS